MASLLVQKSRRDVFNGAALSNEGVFCPAGFNFSPSGHNNNWCTRHGSVPLTSSAIRSPHLGSEDYIILLQLVSLSSG